VAVNFVVEGATGEWEPPEIVSDADKYEPTPESFHLSLEP
jgi:hypothetical protein